MALTLADLNTIEDMTSCGCKVEMIATHLGLAIPAFKRMCKDSSHVEQRIKRGRAKDEWEYRAALREAALTMKQPIITIWAGKQLYGMSDKVTTEHRGESIIMVDTGITSRNKTIIDHE